MEKKSKCFPNLETKTLEMLEVKGHKIGGLHCERQNNRDMKIILLPQTMVHLAGQEADD